MVSGKVPSLKQVRYRVKTKPPLFLFWAWPWVLESEEYQSSWLLNSFSFKIVAFWSYIFLISLGLPENPFRHFWEMYSQSRDVHKVSVTLIFMCNLPRIGLSSSRICTNRMRTTKWGRTFSRWDVSVSVHLAPPGPFQFSFGLWKWPRRPFCLDAWRGHIDHRPHFQVI